MGAFYRLQVVRYQQGQSPCVVVNWPPGRDAEKDLITDLVARVQAKREPIPDLMARVQAKGVGLWSSEAYVLSAVEAEIRESEATVLADVQAAIQECFHAAKTQVTP